MRKRQAFFVNIMVNLPIVIVLLAPIVKWLVECIQQDKLLWAQPYSLNDIHLAFIFSLLSLIYYEVRRKQTSGGDESRIIPNRNRGDYDSIREACLSGRSVRIEALGHSFNTLWFNFIKRFVYEVIRQPDKVQHVEITLISTRKGKNCFPDVKTFHGGLEESLKSRVSFNLVEIDRETFFTGVCVNREILWFSLREPFSSTRANEHVREWARWNNETSMKMVDWFTGIVDYLLRYPVKRLGTLLPPGEAASTHASPAG